MLNTPDQGVNQRKEAILQKSPLLRALLDPRILSDKYAWSTFVLKFTKARTDIRETLRNSGETADKALLSVPPILSDIFNPSVQHNTKLVTISIVMSIGYEIGDIVEASMFLNDIRRQLIDFQILNPQPEKDSIIRESLMSTLAMGAERKQRASTDRLSVFRDFVDRLDNSES